MKKLRHCHITYTERQFIYLAHAADVQLFTCVILT